jgi:hypothetical protein
VRLGCHIFRASITLPATVKVQCDDAELASRERQLGTSWTFYAISVTGAIKLTLSAIRN